MIDVVLPAGFLQDVFDRIDITIEEHR